MKTYLVTLCLFLLLPAITFSQPFDALTLHRGTYIGTGLNTNWHYVADMKVDAQGYVYICGSTSSFPTTSGAYQQSIIGDNLDGYICKMSPDLSTIIWSTYLGGTGSDGIFSMDFLPNGDVVVCGGTSSTNFPLLSTNDQAIVSSICSDCFISSFVARLSANGSQLLFARVLGKLITGLGILTAVSPNNEIYVSTCCPSTWTFSTTANAYQVTGTGGRDLTITKLNQNGVIEYSSYFGGNADEILNSSRMIFANNRIYFTGMTKSANFPLASGKTPDAQGDCFVAVWQNGTVPTPVGSYIVGGAAADEGIALNYNSVTNKIMVCGTSQSTDMPYTRLLQTGQQSGGFVASINADLSGIDYLNILGANIRPTSLQSRINGDVYCAAGTLAAGASIPLTPTAYSTSTSIQNCNLLFGFSPTGTLKYGSYMSGEFWNNLSGARVSMALYNQTSCTFSVCIGVGATSIVPTTGGTYQPNRPNGGVSGISIFRSARLDTLDVTAGTVCGEYLFRLKSSSYAPCQPVQYLWSFGDGSPVRAGSDTTRYKFNTNGSFNVVVRVVYPGGDTNVVARVVAVQSQPVIAATPRTNYRCPRDNGVPLLATGGVRYAWSP
ncbi:MAG: PKD domain-containing protein, partial [Candidatus Kapabacteria bacterium]|nr:PKD domain-containing protein [Candidatus Kapabacteria bacterium]